MANVVEIAFDLSGDPNLNFATLDDPVKGILGSTTYVLGGALLIDVTDKVIGYRITRGKSRQLDRYPSGRLSVILDNNDRTFDPLYDASPYAGQIIPRRDVQIRSEDIIQYRGVIDDWNLNYSPNGKSEAEIVASDSLTILANQALPAGTATSQFSGERVTAILDDPSVNWPTDKRNIETGQQTLQADVIEAGTNALEYLQLVTASEPGSLFIGKQGNLTFKDRQTDQSSADVLLLADDGTGVPYQNIQVVYGAELLYNQVIVSRLNGGTATANNLDSQTTYGITTLTLSDLLMDSDADAQDLADFLVLKYSEPEYRFETVTVILDTITAEQREDVLGLELGDTVQVKFTPNDIAPAISRYAEIIRINQTVTQTSHSVTLGLASLDFSFWRLSDAVFGRLSSGNSLAY